MILRTTPGPHNKNPRHNIFAKGWVAQTNIFDRYSDGCAQISQDFPRVGSEKTGIFYTQFAIQDSRLFGPNPWENLSAAVKLPIKKRFLGNPTLGRKACDVKSCYANRV